ncbi:hypothetical protein BH09PSE4_BH09PSE4_09620 [soil metagenome]
MFKTILATVATLTFSTAAHAAPERSFTRDGETFVYTATDLGDRVILAGHEVSSGTAFRLVVRGDNVTGMSGGVPVSFRKVGAQAAALVVAERTEISAR